MTSTEPSPETAPSGRVRTVALGGLAGYFGALRDFDRNAKLFLVCTAFRGLTIATMQIALNLYLYSLGFDLRTIGFINGVNAVAVLLASFPLGLLADRFGRRVVLRVTGVLYPLTILGLSLSGTPPLIVLFMILFGAVSDGYWVAGIPFLYANTRAEQRVQAFSVNSFLLWGLGPLGAFLSGEVVQIASRILGVSASDTAALRYGMFLMVALAALGAVPYLFLRPTGHLERGADAAKPPLGGVIRLATQLLLPDAFLAFGIGCILTFAQLFFHLRFGLDPGPIGIIIGIGGLIAGIGTLSTPLVARRWGNLRTAVRVQWTNVPFMALLAVSGQLFLAIPAYWIVITLRGMVDPVYNAFIQERVPDAYRGRVTGFYSVTYSIGFSLGPAASGQLQKIGGFTPAFLLGAGSYLIGASLLHLFFGRGSTTSRVDEIVDDFVDGGVPDTTTGG